MRLRVQRKKVYFKSNGGFGSSTCIRLKTESKWKNRKWMNDEHMFEDAANMFHPSSLFFRFSDIYCENRFKINYHKTSFIQLINSITRVNWISVLLFWNCGSHFAILTSLILKFDLGYWIWTNAGCVGKLTLFNSFIAQVARAWLNRSRLK